MMSTVFVIATLMMTAQAAPGEVAPAAAPPPFRCPTGDVTDLRTEWRDAALSALTEACATLASEPFRLAVENRKYREACGNLTRIRGADLTTMLAKDLPDFRFAEGLDLAEDVNGETRTGQRRMAINPNRFKLWLAGEDAGKADLVKTIAHELTHLIGEQDSPSQPRFRDAGNNWLTCTKKSLVSYNVGNSVRRLWLKRAGTAG